jgi:predicted dehydrogenase
MSTRLNRRDFSRAATAVSAAFALAPPQVFGASEQVRLGFIGVGNRGCQLLKGFLAHPDAKIAALCDVYAPYLTAEYAKVDPRFANLEKRIPRMPEVPADIARVKDFQTILERKDIDALVIATPDH